jgi:hypothetical protein
MAEDIYEEVVCNHCGGIGCTYCDHTGKVSVRRPARLCSRCGGTGCIYCGYTGWEGLKGKYEE